MTCRCGGQPSKRFRCATCGEDRREEFRDSEPYRCKSCRRAYNNKRKRELKVRLRNALPAAAKGLVKNL